jgi:putative phosphoribosyl transferase
MFKNREEAGKKLAERLKHYRGRSDTIVIGLARGGVVVAAEIAKALELPLNVVVPRKVGAPGNPELALGAVTELGGYFNESLIHKLHVSKHYLEQEVARERAKAQERQALYAKYAPKPVFTNQTVILVDDGVATGATLFASIEAIRRYKPACLIAALPVSSISAMNALKRVVDEVVCIDIEELGSVSMSYEIFSQVEDKDVIALLKKK